MKKQIVSFCALFGLVLVLSVYYLLLPNNLFVSSITNNEDLSVNVTIQESSNLYFTELDNKLDNKHNDKILSLEQVVCSHENTNEEKEVALNLIEAEIKVMENEKMIVSLIKEVGYYNAFVEYQNDLIKVIVQADSLTNEQAAELMSIVIDNSINALLPEIEYIA